MSSNYVTQLFAFVIMFLIFPHKKNLTIGDEHEQTITELIVSNICNESRSPRRCTRMLEDLIGTTFRRPFETVVLKFLDVSKKGSARTHALCGDHFKAIDRRNHLSLEKPRYVTCQDNLRLAVQTIKLAKRSAREDKRLTTMIEAKNALEKVDELRALFVQHPPSDPSTLTADLNVIGDVLSIVIAICNNL